jgi:arylsulfatase A-like enzyme
VRPNVILITTDQQRYDTLHCNGSKFMKTPNLDRLADMGLRFERGYCANPVCTPSRVSIMTGMLPSRHGSYNIGTVTDKQDIFLSSILREQGYRTHHIGKAHFYPSDVPSEENRPIEGMKPFENFAGFQTAELTIGHNDWGITGHYKEWLKSKGYDKEKASKDFHVELLLKKDTYATGELELPLEYHSSSWIVDRVENFLTRLEPEQPFFLNIGFQDPHHPHILPKNFNNRLSMDEIPMPTKTFDPSLEHLKELSQGTIEGSRFAGKYKIAGNQDTVWNEYFKDTNKTATTRRHYYSMVQLLDEQIGKIMDLLAEKELLSNSIIVFTSDHGEMLGDHGIGQKGPVAFEEVIRVPLIVAYPKKIKPQVVSECVSLMDLYPTILDYIDLEIPKSCDGRSLKKLVESGLNDRIGIPVEFTEEKDAIRYRCFVTKDWKLVVYPGEEFGELYHLSEDPGENNNLYYDTAYSEIKFDLMKKWLEDMEFNEPMNLRPSRC